MSIELRHGERLYLKWTLPFDVPPAGQVTLPTNGDDLTFFDANGEMLSTYNRITDGSEYWLSYEDGKWTITFDTNDTSFLPVGESRYEWVLLDADGLPMMTDEGTVTVHG